MIKVNLNLKTFSQLIFSMKENFTVVFKEYEFKQILYQTHSNSNSKSV